MFTNSVPLDRVSTGTYPESTAMANTAYLGGKSTGDDKGKVFLVASKNSKWWIGNPFTFDSCGFDWGKIRLDSAADLEMDSIPTSGTITV